MGEALTSERTSRRTFHDAFKRYNDHAICEEKHMSETSPFCRCPLCVAYFNFFCLCLP